MNIMVIDVPSAEPPSTSSPSSSSEQMLRMLTSISVTAHEKCVPTTLPWRFKVNICTFFADEGQGPGEDVHEVWQPVGMWRAIKLSNVHHVVLVFQYGSYKRETDAD